MAIQTVFSKKVKLNLRKMITVQMIIKAVQPINIQTKLQINQRKKIPKVQLKNYMQVTVNPVEKPKGNIVGSNI